MNNSDTEVILKSISLLEESVKLIIQLLDCLSENNVLKSVQADSDFVYRYVRKVDFGAGKQRKVIETFKLELNGFLTLVSTEVQDDGYESCRPLVQTHRHA